MEQDRPIVKAIGRALPSLLIFCLVACSQRTMLDTMSTPEERAFATGVVEKMRAGDLAALEPQFDPGTWQGSRPLLPRAPAEYPRAIGTTELVGYHFNRNVALSGNSAARNATLFVLMTTDGRRWTRTSIQTVATNGGRPLIVAWNVQGTDQIPEDYRQYLAMERMIPWMRGAALGTVLAIAGAAFWFIRRRRMRRSEEL